MSDAEPNDTRASVDQDACVGHGGCRRIAPTAFRRTPVGQSEFVDGHGESDASLREAAENCPVAAIVVLARDSGTQLYPP